MEDNNKKSALGIISLILGIVACIPVLNLFSGVPVGIAAFVTGIIQKKKNPANKPARLGFLLGIIAIVLTIGMYGVVLFMSAPYLTDGTPTQQIEEEARENTSEFLNNIFHNEN